MHRWYRYDIYGGTGLSDMSRVTSVLLPGGRGAGGVGGGGVKNFDEHLSTVVKWMKAAELL